MKKVNMNQEQKKLIEDIIQCAYVTAMYETTQKEFTDSLMENLRIRRSDK